MARSIHPVVVGTAGHIDHGKSSLVKALTGIDPDRLKEEKERGLTIDLGFARLKMAEIPRNGNPTRVRNRCATTGRPRGVYRKFGLNRIEIRNLGNKGMIPGLTKSSW